MLILVFFLNKLMGVTPEELEANNGLFVKIIDFTGTEYNGTLYYDAMNQFSVEIWKNNDASYITFIAPEDIDILIPENSLMFSSNPIFAMNLISNCRDLRMPNNILLSISGINKFCNCLSEDNYILEWNTKENKYSFDYDVVCNCSILHADLFCSKNQWICYLALKNKEGLTCVDGIVLDFPLDRITLTGKTKMHFTQTGTCSCGPCVDDYLIISFEPIE